MRFLRLLRILGPVAAGLALASPAVADSDGFRLKPSELQTTGKPGSVRRTVQPFGSWTLVCDENLAKRRRVCNISQTFLDEKGGNGFSWSLAATKGGAAAFILRAPSEGAGSRVVYLALDGEEPREVALTNCNDSLCVGFLEVGREMGKRLRKGGTAAISFLHDGRLVRIAAPLDDLKVALAGLK